MAATAIDGFLKNAAGGAADGEKWTLVFHLQPWRRLDTLEMPAAELRVEIPTTHAALRTQMVNLREGVAVRVAADSLVPPDERGWWLARGSAVEIRSHGDDVLNAARQKLNVPVIVHDPVLGTLTLDRRFNWFTGSRRSEVLQYELSIEQSSPADNPSQDRRDIERARHIVTRFEEALVTIRTRIAAELLDTYNSQWRDGEVLSEDAFLASVRLQAAVLSAGGRATLYFDDGGLLRGHAIEVRLGVDGSVSEVCLAG